MFASASIPRHIAALAVKILKSTATFQRRSHPTLPYIQLF
jgi:hypothetical protein